MRGLWLLPRRNGLRFSKPRCIQLVNAHAGEVELAKAAEQHERAQDLQQQRYHHWQDTESLVTRVKAWLD